jgi:hypothetical protein
MTGLERLVRYKHFIYVSFSVCLSLSICLSIYLSTYLSLSISISTLKVSFFYLCLMLWQGAYHPYNGDFTWAGFGLTSKYYTRILPGTNALAY